MHPRAQRHAHKHSNNHYHSQEITRMEHNFCSYPSWFSKTIMLHRDLHSHQNSVHQRYHSIKYIVMALGQS
ncbi:hypothetical protein BDR04DRAFT_668414 [Suillus decipiens]|nr:hypothetical protein BDR04DRAFT_668414 [Suillus decipiens]